MQDSPSETTKPARRSKLLSLDEAAGMVKDGMTVSIGGNHSHEAPCAFARALVRRGVKDLTIVPSNAAGYQVDLLIGGGCVKTLYNSYCGLDYIGAAPNFRRFAESGKLDVLELDEMGLMRGLKASVAGVAFFPLPDGFLGLDVWRVSPDFYRVIEDPFTGRKVVVVPPIRPAICIIHVPKCDEFGNAIEPGVLDNVLHQAAERVILTTDEIVPLDYTRAHHTEVTVFGKFVSAVVKVPYGAHPGQCSGHYTHDEDHLREYQAAGRDDAGFRKYLDKYVVGKSNEQYLEAVGISRLLKLKYY
jgi:glutaconate CoA-transferase subunit A